MKGSGFLRTLLLRRVGSTIYAGMNTAKSMLGAWEDIEEDDDGETPEEKPKSLTPTERHKLTQFLDKLEANQDTDPKYEVVRRLLIDEDWLDAGCIIFSQYFDSIQWLAEQLSRDLPKGESIGLYAGGQKSGIVVDGIFTKQEREQLKKMVRRGEIRLLLGTDAASEGLNLQQLGTLINLDLPWNPTRLEQRKGRIRHSALCGYKALWLLSAKEPDYISTITSETWEKWVAIILAYPSTGEKDKEIRQKLTKTAYLKAPDEFIKILNILIDKENSEHGYIHILDRIICCWNDRLAEFLFDKAQDDNLTANTNFQ
jgi:superfamily II DNA/RNA helicase